MGNQRVFYACQGICYNDVPVEGVQSVTLNTQQENIILDQYGSLKIHKYVPNYPEVTIGVSRIISSGIGLIYSGTIEDNINTHNNNLCLFIGKDTESKLAESPASDTYNILLSGVSINSVAYNFPANGNFTEDIELKCYHKYFNQCLVSNTVFSQLRSSGLVNRRQHLSSSESIIAQGLLPADSNITNVTIDANFGIQDIKEFGMNVSNPNQQYRYATLPITVTTTVNAVINGSGLDFYDIDTNSSEATHLCKFSGLNSGIVPLKFILCGSQELNVGTGSLTSVSYDGGDTGGGSVEVSLTFESANQFTLKKIP
jgi:hypothetical protein